MQLISIDHCILISLISVFTTVSESDPSPVKLNLHDSATLSCSERCSGLVRWTEFHKRSDTLAECDQTSCRSVKEGYQMIRDQYLKGNLSLIITDADFSKRGWYTCDCDGKDLCDVRLQIEPLNTAVQIEPGVSLMLKLDVSDPVEVIYNSTGSAGPSSGQICTVDGPSLQCKPEYTQRSSLTSALELRNVTPSDSGVYTVMDKRNKEVIHIYTVTVQAVQDSEVWKRAYEKGNSDGYQKGNSDGYQKGTSDGYQKGTSDGYQKGNSDGYQKGTSDGYQKGTSDGYQKGNSDGYQKGVGFGALAVGSAALVIMIGVFFLGVFAAPRVRLLMDNCVQK